VARRGGVGPDELDGVSRRVGTVAARSLEALSRLRGKRIFHPHGAGFTGLLTPIGEASNEVGVLGRESMTIVRLSRSFGLPEWAPDPCGLGLRIPDAYGPGRHQDILMVSSARPVVARHVLMPSRGFFDRPYSTLLPYDLRGRLILIGARAAAPERPGPRLADLLDGPPNDLDFVLEIAGLREEWSVVASLSLQGRLEPERVERLDLDPTNTGGGLRLAGALNRIRGPSYRRSQAGRGLRR
jgi:hypothetical protein